MASPTASGGGAAADLSPGGSWGAAGDGAEGGTGPGRRKRAAERQLFLEGKVIVVGRMSVGKTSLILRLVKDEFDGKTQPSIGVAYFQHTATAGNVTLCANIWDTAGQERFRGVNALYLRKAAAAILTFDVTQRASFDDLAEWHRRVVDAAVKGVIIVIAANKCDSPPSRRQVSEEEGRAFAEEHGASYVETSAKTGKGVKELFEVIAERAPSQLQLKSPTGGGGAGEDVGGGGLVEGFRIAKVEKKTSSRLLRDGSDDAEGRSRAAGGGGSGGGGCCR